MYNINTVLKELPMKTLTFLSFATAALYFVLAIATFVNNEGTDAWAGLAFWLAHAALCAFALYHARKQLQKQKIQQTRIGSAW
jgi:EamA domain-containing membrane protein RarD